MISNDAPECRPGRYFVYQTSETTPVSTTIPKIPTHRTLSIGDIQVPHGRRAANLKNIERLAESIKNSGLLSPILVRVSGDPTIGEPQIVILVAGRHRLEASKLLGLEEIECLVMDDDVLHADLAEIDENLCRAGLTPAETAAAMVRRKEIYILLHPETASGKVQAKAMNARLGRGNVNENNSPTFTAATAAATGMNRRSVEKAVARGQALKPEDLQKIVGTSLDKDVELDALAIIPSVQRDKLIEKATSGQTVSARDLSKTPEPTASEAAAPPTSVNAGPKRHSGDRDTARMERADQVAASVQKIKDLLAACDPGDRAMIRKNNAPYLDGWFGAEGKLRCTSIELPPSGQEAVCEQTGPGNKGSARCQMEKLTA
jgi:ParB family chromosome partitioning protein